MDTTDGTFTDGTIVRSIQLSVDEMAIPDYGTFTRLDGLPGNPSIQIETMLQQFCPADGNGDIRDFSDGDTPDVPVGLVSGATVTEPFSGRAMELFTGEIDFADNSGPGANDSSAFGIYHGPAVVSDQFRAEAGQFLRLNYTAAGDVDDYHVAGYIYEVEADVTDPNYGEPVLDENGDVKFTMALSETGTEQLNGRASVEIEEGGIIDLYLLLAHLIKPAVSRLVRA